MVHKVDETIIQQIQKIDNNKLIQTFQNFHKMDFLKLVDEKQIYKEMVQLHKDGYEKKIEEILSNIDIEDDKKILNDEIYRFVFNFLDFTSLDERASFINKQIDLFLGFVQNKTLELSIYQHIVDYSTQLIKKTNNITFVKCFLELSRLDKKMIGLMIKYKVQTQRPLKEKNLQINSLHFLMTSTSHIQNNLLAPVESQTRYFKKYVQADKDGDTLKKDKLLKIIDKNSFALDDYKKFTQRLSTLFCSFESNDKQDNIKSISFLYFLLDLVFTNGVNIKYSDTTLTVSIDDREDLISLQTILYENILIASIYALIENAVEAKAKHINIDITIDTELNAIFVYIKNDGHKIEKKDLSYIFNDHFSTKNQSGLGLPIVKRWLKEIASDIEFVSSTKDETIFKLKLLLWRI